MGFRQGMNRVLIFMWAEFSPQATGGLIHFYKLTQLLQKKNKFFCMFERNMFLNKPILIILLSLL